MRSPNPILATAAVILLVAITCLASPLESQNQLPHLEFPLTVENMKPKLWPNATVPFWLVGNFSEQHREEIFAAMHEFEKHTCVKFEPYKGEEYDYLFIDSQYPNCFSNSGRHDDRGRQIINLVPPCDKKNYIIHELMHVVGIGHEQNRIDRDDYLIINWENVSDDKKGLLQKFEQTFDVPYDYYSITHYPLEAFSKNGLPTMTPKQSGVNLTAISDYQELTDSDIKKIKSLYKCP